MPLHVLPREFLKKDPNQSWLYVVNSINGDLKRLEKMIYKIEDGSLAYNDKIVFMGNFISAADGSNNRKVLELLQEYQGLRPGMVIPIRGANEQHMVQSRPTFFTSPLGKSALQSYRMGLTHMPFKLLNRGKTDKGAFAFDRAWLGTLPYYYQSSKYFFVHAGVNPDKDLDKQNVGGFPFIQDYFYKSNRKYEKLIVHTSSQAKSDLRLNRIGFGQKEKQLTCLVLNDRWPKPVVDIEDAPLEFGKLIEGQITVD